MARRRKEEQLGLFKARGGKRRGAGRRPKAARAGAAHKARAELKGRYPVHVVLRVAGGVGNLRRRDTYLAICKATEMLGDQEDFRIVHLSIQRTHLHLIVEAANQYALAWNLQRFQVSAAKHINGTTRDDSGNRRRGAVFPDRYHASIIKTPTQARNTLGYVLSNWRRHKEDREGVFRTWKIDWFASSIAFTGWAEYHDADFPRCAPNGYVPLRVCPATTWLLREGWRRAGGLISCYVEPQRH